MTEEKMKFNPELDGETISKLGLLNYKYSEMHPLEQYGIRMSDYWHSLLIKYFPYSFVLCAVYVIFIYVGQIYMKNRRAFNLRIPMTLWNAVLALVSIIGTWRCVRVLLNTVFDYGFMYSVCHPHFYYNANAFWGFLFIISKPIELGDTVFIVLRKQPLIFLHWYHHVTVMLYVFASFYEHSAPGNYFHVINFAVHAIMYTYYTLKALRIRMPKFIPMIVTSIQLSQMVFGSAILLYVYWLRYFAGSTCQITDRLLYCGLIMYLSYFILFGHFFYQAYYCGNFWGRVRRISKSISVPTNDEMNSSSVIQINDSATVNGGSIRKDAAASANSVVANGKKYN